VWTAPRLERMYRMLGSSIVFSIAPDVQSGCASLQDRGAVVYPLSIQCPACNAFINIEKPGRGRCEVCEAVITAFPDGAVSLG